MDQEYPTVGHASLFIRNELRPHYPGREIQGFTELIFEYLLNFNKTDILLNNDTKLSNSVFFQIKEITKQLLCHKPIQYILGEAWFYGIRLRVTPDVLIPRQETEELVKWIIDDTRIIPVSLADIGTGSGCIAMALALNLPLARVTATDISDRAVALASENARNAGADIRFIVEDIFNPVTLKSEKFDILVSNPPYITESEKRLVDKNVLYFEPLEALFVPDNQALKYYNQIASLAVKILKPGGKLFFEINENKADQIEELLIRLMFSGIEVKKDINGKDRMVRAVMDPPCAGNHGPGYCPDYAPITK
jgi:release factor glutamine methyltransferase